ncbi:MAG TPA: entericidin A/B family lipoprotein [Casimicrobiaceae bacterium]|jgi:predicted small secreted protein|nr:entericidin A/B family lipoprotein [Casimicrobiaceae bacterium]
MVRKLAAALALAGFALGLAACNTVEGMGKDIKAGGAAIESAADKSKPK